MTSGYPPIEESLDRLHRSGWSVGDVAFHAEGSGLAWVVVGTNGENKIRAEGATAREAWFRAVAQAGASGCWRTNQGDRRAGQGPGGVRESILVRASRRASR